MKVFSYGKDYASYEKRELEAIQGQKVATRNGTKEAKNLGKQRDKVKEQKEEDVKNDEEAV